MKMMTTWVAIGVILLYASVEIQGINIPQEWKELLSYVCKENDASCTPPIVRDVLTFSSASEFLCKSTNVSFYFCSLPKIFQCIATPICAFLGSGVANVDGYINGNVAWVLLANISFCS